MKKLIKLKARPGIGFPLALVITLVGSLIVTLMFNTAANFMAQTTHQQDAYLGHSLGASYIEEVKGIVSQRLNELADGEPVLHRPGYYEEPREPIESKDDLLITMAFESNDVTFEEGISLMYPGRGARARVSLFDVGYTTGDLHGDFRNAAGAIKDDLTPTQRQTLAKLPPPMTMSVRDSEYNEEGAFENADEHPYDPEGFDILPGGLDFDKVGMYVVRVEILDGNDELIRFFEESFYQVASEDV